MLVARDGVAFTGTGHDPELIARLPWLDGARLAPRDDGLAPITGLDVVNDLLTQVQLHAPHLYAAWHVVSIAHLASDNEVEVRTHDGVSIVFNARGDFFRQLAKLDYLWEKIANAPDSMAQVARIDLSLGREVPVRLQLAPAAQEIARGKKAPAGSVLPSRFIFPTQPKSKREL
jgi:cell division protein FtsQ